MRPVRASFNVPSAQVSRQAAFGTAAAQLEWRSLAAVRTRSSTYRMPLQPRATVASLGPERGGGGWLHGRPMLPGHRGTQAVHARGGAGEQLGLFIGGVVGDQALERVPHDGVAAADLVHGEIRLEHAAVHTELLDDEVVVAPRGLDQLLAGRWPRPLTPAKAVDIHVDAPQLGDD